MAVNDTIRISGLAELQKALDGLPLAVQAEIVGPALAAGGEVIRRGAEQRIRSRSGKTAKSLVVAVRKAPQGPFNRVGGVAQVGADKSRDYVLRFLEFGTKPHPIPKERKRKRKTKKLSFGGKAYGKVNHPGTRPQAPLTRALAEDAQAAIGAFRDVALQGIEDYCNRMKTT